MWWEGERGTKHFCCFFLLFGVLAVFLGESTTVFREEITNSTHLGTMEAYTAAARGKLTLHSSSLVCRDTVLEGDITIGRGRVFLGSTETQSLS